MNKDEKYIKYGKLLSGLIHNLNTPLMGMSGRIELLQMKFDDEKSFKQIETQFAKINEMLTSIAALLDKDQTDKDLEFDLKSLLDSYFSFIYTDMRFKHQIEKELSFVPCNVMTNPSDLINCIHTIVDYLLECSNEDSTLYVDNTSIDGAITVNFCLKYNPEENTKNIPQDIDLNKIMSERLTEDIFDKFKINTVFSNNEFLKINLYI